MKLSVKILSMMLGLMTFSCFTIAAMEPRMAEQNEDGYVELSPLHVTFVDEGGIVVIKIIKGDKVVDEIVVRGTRQELEKALFGYTSDARTHVVKTFAEEMEERQREAFRLPSPEKDPCHSPYNPLYFQSRK